MSNYNKIETAAELVAEVQLHGLSTNQEDICRAQDIFGNTPLEELARLANDIGRDNDQGEPDPKGTRCSGRRATQSTFYSILSSIWHWEEVTRFWNQYTNPQTEEVKELREDNKTLKTLYDDLRDQYGELKGTLLESANSITDLRTRVGDAQKAAEAAEAEVMRLKAKLYDLIVEGKEASQ